MDGSRLSGFGIHGGDSLPIRARKAVGVVPQRRLGHREKERGDANPSSVASSFTEHGSASLAHTVSRMNPVCHPRNDAPVVRRMARASVTGLHPQAAATAARVSVGLCRKRAAAISTSTRTL